MKFKLIDAKDVAVLREACKILKKLKKRENKLNAIEDGELTDTKKEWKTAALEHWRMLDELNALHIGVEENGDMSLDAQ